MEDAELGWLAGVLDADGSIGMSRRTKTSGSPYPIYSAQVQVTSTRRRMIDRLVALFHGLGVDKKVTTMERSRKGYVETEFYLNIGRHQDVETILEAVLPFLFLKREQAIICVAFVRRRMKIGWPAANLASKGSSSFTTEDVESWRSLRRLNRKRTPAV